MKEKSRYKIIYIIFKIKEKILFSSNNKYKTISAYVLYFFLKKNVNFKSLL